MQSSTRVVAGVSWREVRRVITGKAQRLESVPAKSGRLAAGWPGEYVSEASGRARVYTAISSLRTLGLGDILLRGPDGYALDPRIAVEVGEA